MKRVKKRLATTTLLVGSGKGGVGKSTVTVNLAIALAQKNYSVAVLDADLYGPSIPILLGLRNISPQVVEEGERELIIPLFKFGIRVVSIGFFLEEARSVLWRGPILHGAISKLVEGVKWGELDFLLVDLPPGTGDILISLNQLLEVDGGLVVSTPQDVAVLDAMKAIHAFDQLSIPLFGMIENMTGFTVPGTEETYYLFGRGKGHEIAEKFETDLLVSIPLIPEIREGGDEGKPLALQQSNAFHNLADSLLKKCKLSKSPTPIKKN